MPTRDAPATEPDRAAAARDKVLARIRTVDECAPAELRRLLDELHDRRFPADRQDLDAIIRRLREAEDAARRCYALLDEEGRRRRAEATSDEERRRWALALAGEGR